jgi:hypothetical protein
MMSPQIPTFITRGALLNDSHQWASLGTSSPGGEFIYRFYDDEMRLLYVGVTWNPYSRWVRHRRTQPWWPDIRYFDLHQGADSRASRHWETWCIRNLNPIHNKMQNRRWHNRGKNPDDQAGVPD